MESSGVRQRAVATSPEERKRHEAAWLDEIREQFALGSLTMGEAQQQLVEVLLHRTVGFPQHLQDRLRETLLEVVETDPYFQLLRDDLPEI